MNRSDLWQEIISDTRTLVARGANRAKGTIELSPDVLARLQAFVPLPTEIQDELFAGMETPEPAPAAQTMDLGTDLAALAQVVAACEQCGLCKTRTQTVFGVGNPQAELVFVGEAPGAEEDRRGEPFVGRAGQLLTDIIEKGMKMSREDVYICNVLKCRPPENRDPNPEEVMHCEPYLIRQLELIQPKVIVALGRIAAQTLLKTDKSMARLRGEWHQYQGIPLRATYHPSYLLRKPEDKRLAWDDIKEVMKFLSGEVKLP